MLPRVFEGQIPLTPCRFWCVFLSCKTQQTAFFKNNFNISKYWKNLCCFIFLNNYTSQLTVLQSSKRLFLPCETSKLSKLHCQWKEYMQDVAFLIHARFFNVEKQLYKKNNSYPSSCFFIGCFHIVNKHNSRQPCSTEFDWESKNWWESLGKGNCKRMSES